MKKTDKIFVAGHRGMVGSAILRKLNKEGLTDIVTKTSAELDLRNQRSVNIFFENEKESKMLKGGDSIGNGIRASETVKTVLLKCGSRKYHLALRKLKFESAG